MPTTERPKPAHWRQAVAPTVLILGVVMIAASFFLPTRSVGRVLWTDDQAARYQAASARLHELSHAQAHSPSNGDADRLRKELKAAQTEYDELRAELDRAREAPVQFARMLRWGGLAVALAGGVVYFATSQQ